MMGFESIRDVLIPLVVGVNRVFGSVLLEDWFSEIDLEVLGDGLDIKDELEAYYQKEIHHGQLYPTLNTLVDKGLAEKRQADGRMNSYLLTDRGRREIEARREWENTYIGSKLSV